jgi:hypothetical protein
MRLRSLLGSEDVEYEILNHLRSTCAGRQSLTGLPAGDEENYSLGSRFSRSDTLTPTSAWPPKAVPVFFFWKFSSACL